MPVVKKKILLCALALIVAAAAVITIYCNNGPKGPAGQCSLIIRCDTVLQHMDELNSAKHAYIPENGEMLNLEYVTFYEGDSAFDVLRRELTSRKMQFEFTKTPVTGGVYIEGIGNLYEFEINSLSGWQFSINGEFFSVDCSAHTVRQGDTIAFLYTCDLGKDIQGSIY